MKFLITIICLISTVNLYSQWQELGPTIFQPRHHPVTFSIDGVGYLTMGVNAQNQVLKDFFKFDPNTNSWEELTPYPGPGRGFSYADTWEGKAYIGFGVTPAGYTNDLWSYDAETETWEELPSCPCAGRAHPAYVIVNGSLYIGAGNDNIVGNMRDFWRYDIEERTWTRIDDLPGVVRHHPFYFGIGDYVYAGLGHGNMNAQGQMIWRDFYRYDTNNETWERVADIPGEGRVAGTQFSFNGKGYVLSGQNEMHENFTEGEFWEYNPASDSWRQLESHPGATSRWAPGNFVIDNTLYFMAGMIGLNPNYFLVNDVLTYDLSGLASVDIAKKYNAAIINNQLIFSLEDNANLQIEMVDLNGNGTMISNRLFSKGEHSIPLNMMDKPAGAYFVKIANIDRSEAGTVKYMYMK